jgi:WhiB family redox-sensing transcriptional regulator
VKPHAPFSDLGRYQNPRVDTPPAAEIIASVRRGTSYDELAAIYGCSVSTLRRRVQESGLIARRRQGAVPALLEDDIPAWMADGLCAQTDPEMFFPEAGRTPRGARNVCKECPVAVQCLAYALDRDERFGIWGGMTPTERRRLKKGGQ